MRRKYEEEDEDEDEDEDKDGKRARRRRTRAAGRLRAPPELRVGRQRQIRGPEGHLDLLRLVRDLEELADLYPAEPGHLGLTARLLVGQRGDHGQVVRLGRHVGRHRQALELVLHREPPVLLLGQQRHQVHLLPGDAVHGRGPHWRSNLAANLAANLWPLSAAARAQKFSTIPGPRRLDWPIVSFSNLV